MPQPSAPLPSEGLAAARAAWLAGDRAAWARYAEALTRLGRASECLAAAPSRHTPRPLTPRRGVPPRA